MLYTMWCIRVGADTRTPCRDEEVPNGDAAADVASPRRSTHSAAGGCAGIDVRTSCREAAKECEAGVRVSVASRRTDQPGRR